MTESTKQPIKAILIDVDNTLLDFNKCAEFSMRKAFEHFGMKFDHSMFAHFLEVNDYLWGEIEQGSLTKDELYEIRWDMIFKRIGNANVISGVQFEKIFLKHLASSAESVDGAHELLAYLSEKYIVCIASNAPYEQQMKRLQSADMLRCIDKLFISEQIGHAKPSVKFFDACMAQLPGVLPHETAIIGDSLTADIIGGIEYGLVTCWFSQSQLPKVSSQPDFIVNSLNDIQKIF